MLILVVKVPKRFSVSNQPVGALSAAGASVRVRVLRVGRRRGETVPHAEILIFLCLIHNTEIFCFFGAIAQAQ